MATKAASPLAGSVEKTNGTKLSGLLIDGETEVLMKVFDNHHPPANLVTDLNTCYVIHKTSTVAPPVSSTLEITLLFLLMTNGLFT